jgi:localization factor PodJL
MRSSSKQAEKERSEGSTISRRARAFLVGAGVIIGVVILGLGAFLAIHVLPGGGGSVSQATQNSSTNNSAQIASDHAEPVETSPVQVETTQSQPAANDDISRTISAAPVKVGLGVVQVPQGERLPDGIGGPILRGAAMKGDPAAAYEVGLRFAEGKGVAINYGEAAKWLDRAVQAGVVPAAFEIGKLYEKGLGVAKDLDIARRYYTQAAERGNAGAMHNLAVFEADSGNHKSAARSGSGRRPIMVSSTASSTSPFSMLAAWGSRRTSSNPTSGSALRRRRVIGMQRKGATILQHAWIPSRLRRQSWRSKTLPLSLCPTTPSA